MGRFFLKKKVVYSFIQGDTREAGGLETALTPRVASVER